MQRGDMSSCASFPAGVCETEEVDMQKNNSDVDVRRQRASAPVDGPSTDQSMWYNTDTNTSIWRMQLITKAFC
jgi:hypothetical protein